MSRPALLALVTALGCACAPDPASLISSSQAVSLEEVDEGALSGRVVACFEDAASEDAAMVAHAGVVVVDEVFGCAVLEGNADPRELTWALRSAPGLRMAEPELRLGGPGVVGGEPAPLRQSVPVAEVPVSGVERVVVAVLGGGVVPGAGHGLELVPGFDAVDMDADPRDPGAAARQSTELSRSIAAAAEQVSGAAVVVDILPVRVRGADGTGTSVQLARGIDAAVAGGAELIHLPAGGDGGSALVAAALEEAALAGVVVLGPDTVLDPVDDEGSGGSQGGRSPRLFSPGLTGALAAMIGMGIFADDVNEALDRLFDRDREDEELDESSWGTDEDGWEG